METFEKPSECHVNLTGVALIDDNSAIVIGEKGTILKTTDSGSTWQKIDLGITNNLNAISGEGPSISFRNKIIIAGDSILIISFDHGNSWLIQNMPYNITTADQGFLSPLVDTFPDYIRIKAEETTDKTDLFSPDFSIVLGTDDGRIVYSIDDGKTWQDTSLFNSKVIAANFSEYHNFGYGTWSDVSAASVFNYVKGDIVDKKWAKYPIGNYIPWQNITSGDLSGYYEYLIGDGGEVMPEPLLLVKSRDDSTWQNLSQRLPVGLLLVKIKKLGYGYAVFICGERGKILKSTDFGSTWKEQETPTDADLNDIALYNDNIGYAVGDSGTILYTSNGGISGVDEKTENIPAGFKLYQNYPNPFNPNTTIIFSVPFSQKVELSVYDLLGREVATLVNENKSAGNYEVKFDASKLPSGVYFYRLTAGNMSLAKKMLLLR